MAVRLEVTLRLENDQQENTWFSTGNHEEDSDVHVHMSRNMYLAIGSPQNITVTIEEAINGN